MTPGLSQHAPDVDTSESQRQSPEPGSAAVGPRIPGKMPSKRRSCPGTRRPASSDSQRSNAPSLGSRGGPSPLVQQWVRWSWGGLSAQLARAASGEFGLGGYGAAVSSAAGYTPEEGGGRARSPSSRGVEQGEKRGKEGGTWPRPTVEGRAAQTPEGACDSQAATRVDGSRIPGLLGRGQCPRPVPCPGGWLCPGSAGGRARARPGTAAPRRAGGRCWGGPGEDGGVLSHRPAPRRPAPCEVRARPSAGFIRE